MSESREQILTAIRSQRAPDAHLPDLARRDWITYADLVAQFESVLSGVGGNCIRAATIDDVRRELEQLPPYAAAVKTYSLVPGIENRNRRPP